MLPYVNYIAKNSKTNHLISNYLKASSYLRLIICKLSKSQTTQKIIT
jgi:hypothetical protein